MEFADEGPIMHIRDETVNTGAPQFFTNFNDTGLFGEAEASMMFR